MILAMKLYILVGMGFAVFALVFAERAAWDGWPRRPVAKDILMIALWVALWPINVWWAAKAMRRLTD